MGNLIWLFIFKAKQMLQVIACQTEKKEQSIQKPIKEKTAIVSESIYITVHYIPLKYFCFPKAYN